MEGKFCRLYRCQPHLLTYFNFQIILNAARGLSAAAELFVRIPTQRNQRRKIQLLTGAVAAESVMRRSAAAINSTCHPASYANGWVLIESVQMRLVTDLRNVQRLTTSLKLDERFRICVCGHSYLLWWCFCFAYDYCDCSVWLKRCHQPKSLQ